MKKEALSWVCGLLRSVRLKGKPKGKPKIHLGDALCWHTRTQMIGKSKLSPDEGNHTSDCLF